MTHEPPVIRERFLIEAINDRLVIIPAREAGRLARLNNALEQVKTWDEALSAVKNDPVTMRELERELDGALPGAAEPFNPGDIPGVAEGTWPPSPLTLMHQWCPDSVLALGEWHQGLMDDPLFRIDPWRLEEVIEALAEERIEGIEDPGSSVREACGEWGLG